MTSNEPPPIPSNFEIVIRKCIPKELIPELWKCDKNELDNFDTLMDKGSKQLAMFEPPEDISEHILGYMNFPKCLEYFNWNPQSKIAPFPRLHKTLKGDCCMYRNDMYKIFEFWKIFPFRGVPNVTNLAEAIREDCWKRLKAGSHHEMIICPYEPNNKTTDYPYKLAVQGSISDVQFEKFKVEWKAESEKSIGEISDLILESMEKYLRTNPDAKLSFKDQANAISWIGYLMERAAKFVKDGDIHLPPLHSAVSINNPKPLFRRFSIDNNHLVMAHELLDTMKKCNMDVRKLEKEMKGMLNLSTFPFNEIQKKVGKDVFEKLEFVEMEIDLWMFAQTPIPTPDGGFCILAVDALRDLLMDMILAKKVFQNIGEKDWKCVQKFLELMDFYFDTSRGIYFLDMKVVDAVKTLWESAYDNKMNQSLPDPKLILKKEPEKFKFDVSELVRTLKFLDLDKFIEDFAEYAVPIHERLKEKGCLSPKDMHAAVAQCQINCIAQKIPNIGEFIHNQKACQRMNIVKCEWCQKEAEKPVEDLKKGIVKKPKNKKKK